MVSSVVAVICIIIECTSLCLGISGFQPNGAEDEHFLWYKAGNDSGRECNIYATELTNSANTYQEKEVILATGEIVMVLRVFPSSVATKCYITTDICNKICASDLSRYTLIFISCVNSSRIVIPETAVICQTREPKIVVFDSCQFDWMDVIHLGSTVDIFSLTINPSSLLTNYNLMNYNLSEKSDLQVKLRGLTFVADPSLPYTQPKDMNWIRTLPFFIFRDIFIIRFLSIDLSKYKEDDFTSLGAVGAYIYSFDDTAMTFIPNLQFRSVMSGDFKHSDAQLRVKAHIFQTAPFLFDDIASIVLDEIRDSIGKHNNLYSGPQLIMTNNYISTIPEYPSLSLVVYCDLQQNYLTEQSLHGLQSLEGVALLDLSLNELLKIPDDAFNNLQHLTILFLINNSLTDIENVLWSNTSLKILDLSGNYISSLYLKSILAKIPLLEYLTLYDNNLYDVNFDDLEVTHNLKILDLSFNQLDKIPEHIFSTGITSFEFIGNNINSLGVTSLTTWEKFTFPKERTRGSINLIFNCIEFIPLYTGDDVKSLDHVLRSYNIYLNYNPIHCGCDEFIDWLKSMGVMNYRFIYCNENPMQFTGSFRELIPYVLPISRCEIGSSSYPYLCKNQKRNIYISAGVITSLLFSLPIMLLVIYWEICHNYINYYIYNIIPLKCFTLKHHISCDIQYDCFLMYAGEDFRRCLRIVDILESEPHKYKVCYPDRDFPAGEDFGYNIMDIMMKCKIVLLLLSPAFAQSEWRGFCINAALEERTLRGHPFYVVRVMLGEFDYEGLNRKQRKFLKLLPSLKKNFANIRFFLGEYLFDIAYDDLGNFDESSV